MLKIKKYFKFFTLFAVAFTAFSFLSTQDSFAATKTWTGAGSSNAWSDSANWTPSGAPITGDDLVFDTVPLVASLGSRNDIPSLSISGIQFTGSDSGGSQVVYFDEPTVMTGDIYNNSARQIHIGGGFTLGADIEVDNITSLRSSSVGGALNQIALGGFVFTLSNQSGPQSIDVPITGSGEVVYNGRVGLQLNAINTYSGITMVNNSYIINGVTPSASRHASQMFGTSTIYVDASSSIALPFDTSGAYNNTIHLEATSVSGSTFNAQLEIRSSALGNSVSVSLPNVILSGSGGMTITGSDDVVQVDLAGIQANGNCLYVDTIYREKFVNAPTFCGTGTSSVPGSSVDVVPGVPATGVASEKVSLTTYILASLTVVAGLIGLKKLLPLVRR